ncbi:formylglycine-generating enzyme family protein [Nocardia takedensis]|uniref:formylglycine-generating enzyme family protein n=1 Tax=Nocardia takedensis TaxID=259390 RepID=UPI003F75AC82
MREPTWILVAAGVCAFGDTARRVAVPALWWSATPITTGQAGIGGQDPDLPVTELNHAEATRLAERFGARLPRSVEWEFMAAGAEQRSYPWGEQPWEPALAALGPTGLSGPLPTPGHPRGATPEGISDVAGNVWEWTDSAVMGGGFVIRGGSYASPPLYARCTFLNAAPAELRSAGIGLRMVRPA